MSFISRWTQSISRTGRDSMALSRAVYGAILPGKRSHPTSLAAVSNASFGEKIKTVLLQEARREPAPNSLAISFLKIDKEIGLVKYWGLAEYLRQNQTSFSLSSLSSRLMNPKANTDDSVAAENAASSTSNVATAKVAFMITSSMKRDLADGLGYQASVIKSMTPQQASLVLHHRLGPDSYEAQIIDLEKAFEEEKQKQQQEQLETEKTKAEATSEISAERSDNLSDSSVQSDRSNEDSSSSSPLLLSSSTSHESDESLPSFPSSPNDEDDVSSSTPAIQEIESDADVWYEVVEIKKEGAETVEYRHGLYKDHEEAVLGLETRQDIQRKRDEEAKTTKTNRNEDKDDDIPEVRFVLRSALMKDFQ